MPLFGGRGEIASLDEFRRHVADFESVMPQNQRAIDEQPARGNAGLSTARKILDQIDSNFSKYETAVNNHGTPEDKQNLQRMQVYITGIKLRPQF